MRTKKQTRPLSCRRCASWRTPAGLVLSVVLSAHCWAGAYIFAGDSNGVDVITHPSGYLGASTPSLSVGVCIDAASQNSTELEIPVRNIITVWNSLQPTQNNIVTNALSPGLIDAESVLLHELGHCIGLAHPNLASESGLVGSQTNGTKATPGPNGVLNVAPGADGLYGSHDDSRGDDINLHWFNPFNDPFIVPLITPVDNSLYSRNIADLPMGDNWVVNADRNVSVSMGYPTTEAVMQQGSFTSETQRTLASDDVSSILLAMSGVDETASTLDDYQFVLNYEGIVANANSDPDCDITVSIDSSSFAFCNTTGAWINFPSNHIRITSAEIHLGTGFNWFFNTELLNPNTCGAANDNLTVSNQTITGAQDFEACISIAVGPAVQITSTGNASLTAGTSITLKPGFSVAIGGRFRAIIDTP